MVREAGEQSSNTEVTIKRRERCKKRGRVNSVRASARSKQAESRHGLDDERVTGGYCSFMVMVGCGLTKHTLL